MLGDTNFSAFFPQPAAKVTAMIIPPERLKRCARILSSLGLAVLCMGLGSVYSRGGPDASGQRRSITPHERP